MSVARDVRPSSVSHAETRIGPLPLDARIRVERVTPDRVMVHIERRRSRAFSLSLDEAAYLSGLIVRELPVITVTRQPPKAAGQ